MMKKLCIWLAVILMFPCILLGTTSVSAISPDVMEKSEKEARTYANQNNTWVICYQQGNRTGDLYQYDATSKHIYFSYSLHSCVDVYDSNGTFLYAFIFPDKQNGCVAVRCENDLIFISSKNDILYIFDGTTEIAQMTSHEASSKGYGFTWFDKNEPCISVDKEWISWYGDTGKIIRQIKTPNVIKDTIPPAKSIIFFKLLIMVFFMLYMFLYCTVGIIRKKTQSR